MLKINVTNVTIMVEDMDRAINFYQSIGLTLKQRWENHYAMLSSAGLTIGIHPGGQGMKAGEKISIGFMLDDIKTAKQVLDDNNITYKEDNGKSGMYLHFTDPDGTILYFSQ